MPPLRRERRGKLLSFLTFSHSTTMASHAEASPVLCGFILMLLFFITFFYLFLNGLFNFHQPTNLFNTRINRKKRTLIMGFLPTLLSLALSLLIWGLFIWLYYYSETIRYKSIIFSYDGQNLTQNIIY